MKSIALFLMIASLLGASPMVGNKKGGNTPQTNMLRHRLQENASKGFLFGHQDDPNYGANWSYEKGRSDVKEVCGDYPGIMGFDLGHIELGSSKNLDGVPFADIRKEAINQYERGGVVTLSWHLNNPVTGKDAWDVSDTTVVKSVLVGGKNYQLFQGWLKHVAIFINSIKTSKGVKVPIIFRPWHENTGSWFWWGAKLCSARDYKALWSLTEKTLRDNGVNNVIYAYSPGGDANEQQYMERYPGDKLVDILGVDIYQSNANAEAYMNDVKKSLDFISRVANEHHKIMAFTETGYQALPDAQWWTKVLLPSVKNYPVSYVLVWRNAYDKKDHYFAPYKGEKSAADFVKFYNDPRTIFAKDAKYRK